MAHNDFDKEYRLSDLFLILLVIALMVALTVSMTSCKTQKQASENYKIEQHQELSVSADTATAHVDVKTSSLLQDTARFHGTGQGKIEISRDSAGRPVEIIYVNTFDAESFLSRFMAMDFNSDNSRTNTQIAEETVTESETKGKTKEKTDAGFGLLGLGGFCFLMCVCSILFYIIVKRCVNRWQK